MKKQLCAIAAAVAATLGASSAFAISPLGPFTVTLTISGSSAFQNAFESELSRVGSSVCNNGTVAAPALSYNKFQSSTNDFRAYTCNLAAGVLSAGGGEPAAIYYRGENGSVAGLRPLLAGGPQIKRLLLSNCPVPASGSTTTNTCTISGYVGTTDAVTSGLENATSELGFADEEPLVFTGENYPSAATYAFLQPALSATERTTLNGTAVSVVAQAFGIYVNTGDAELAAVPSLSRNTIGNIFKGTYSDWNTVPNDATGQPVSSGSLPIRLCRREAGSGTQTATSLFFNATSGFVSEANQQALAVSSGGGGVKENASTGEMRTCINATNGAIGFISSEADVAGRHQIQIDGKGTSIAETANNLGTAIATGEYDYWYEMVAIKRPGLAGGANTLANKLISVTQLQTSGPTTPNIAFLSGPNAASYPLVPVAGKQPISCVRRNKDSKSLAFWQC